MWLPKICQLAGNVLPTCQPDRQDFLLSSLSSKAFRRIFNHKNKEMNFKIQNFLVAQPRLACEPLGCSGLKKVINVHARRRHHNPTLHDTVRAGVDTAVY